MDFFEKLEARRKHVEPLTPGGKKKLREILASNLMQDAFALVLNDIEDANKLTSVDFSSGLEDAITKAGSIRGRVQTINDLWDLTEMEEDL